MPPRNDVREFLALVEALPRESLPTVLATVMARMMSLAPVPSPAAKDDVLLTPEVTAARLGLSLRQLYRRASTLPFTRRLGPRTLRFSQAGLEHHLRNGRGGC